MELNSYIITRKHINSIIIIGFIFFIFSVLVYTTYVLYVMLINYTFISINKLNVESLLEILGKMAAVFSEIKFSVIIVYVILGATLAAKSLETTRVVWDLIAKPMKARYLLYIIKHVFIYLYIPSLFLTLFFSELIILINNTDYTPIIYTSSHLVDSLSIVFINNYSYIAKAIITAVLLLAITFATVFFIIYFAKLYEENIISNTLKKIGDTVIIKIPVFTLCPHYITIGVISSYRSIQTADYMLSLNYILLTITYITITIAIYIVTRKWLDKVYNDLYAPLSLDRVTIKICHLTDETKYYKCMEKIEELLRKYNLIS